MTVCFLRGIEQEAGAESLYQRLMLCYSSMNRNAEALSVYNRLETIFSDMGVKPSPETAAIGESLIPN